jgi:hypothetical protein
MSLGLVQWWATADTRHAVLWQHPVSVVVQLSKEFWSWLNDEPEQ